MRELRTVAMRVLAILTTSASTERAFSIGALLCGDYQMAMSPSTLSTRLIVQANWRIASEFVAGVLGMGPKGWKAWETDYHTRRNREIPTAPRRPEPRPDPSLMTGPRLHRRRLPDPSDHEQDDYYLNRLNDELLCRSSDDEDHSSSSDQSDSDSPADDTADKRPIKRVPPPKAGNSCGTSSDESSRTVRVPLARPRKIQPGVIHAYESSDDDDFKTKDPSELFPGLRTD
jgi:hypothetical protein